MAMLISRATGNFTSASTWGVADSATGSQLTAPTTSTNTTTSYVYSSAFTGTNTKVADGVALFLSRGTTTGTFSVALSDDNGVTATRSVTVNASDLPANTAWVFFKFGSTLTLDGGTDYRVGVISSSAGNVAVFRDATAGNWARMISTTDTAAPAAGDTMLIVGELTGAGASNSFTVTMNNTATTDFGNGTATATAPTQTVPQNFNGIQVGNKGTLTWGTSAATAYYLKLSGNLIIWDGGAYNMGTVATPCPRDSSMYLQFDCVTDGDFGFLAFAGSTNVIQGQSRTSGKNIFWCKLSADAAVNATSLSVNTDTGWLSGDAVVVASTTRTASQSEAGTLNGNADASTLTVNGFGGTGGGVAFAHSGTSPTQAEIIHLTRNVRISGSSSTIMSYVSLINCVANFDWAEFFWIGTTVATNKYGIGISASLSGGDVNIQYCSIRETETNPIFLIGTSVVFTIVVSNNCIWRATNGISILPVTFSGSITVSNNIVIANSGSGDLISVGFGTYTDNIVVGGSNGFNISSIPTTFSGITAHSCNSAGLRIQNITSGTVTAQNISTWRTNSAGIIISGSNYVIIDNALAFGNFTNGISTGGAITYIKNSTLAGDTSFAQGQGILASSGNLFIESSTFGVASGIYVAHSTADIGFGSPAFVSVYLQNTLLASSTEVVTTFMIFPTFVKSSKHDQTEGAFRSWFVGGRIDLDTTIFNTASPSERLTPSSASVKLQSGSRIVAVDDLGTVTINAYVRKSVAGDGAAYNGNQPRLILKANPACGIASDTVLDTMTVAAGSWEQLTGTTSAVDADGALEFVVDCDGTTGWVNVDDWSVS